MFLFVALTACQKEEQSNQVDFATETPVAKTYEAKVIQQTTNVIVSMLNENPALFNDIDEAIKSDAVEYMEDRILFADLFKTFGMVGGMVVVSFLDEKTEPLSYDVVWWKKLIRIVLGVVLAVALKEAIKLVNVFDVMQISLLIDAIRYFIVVMTVGYLCPLLFKKIKL
jgi:hypothetical protein